jgi:8-oxo-dGTP pyrophosphatase MutT (NUDIX family)
MTRMKAHVARQASVFRGQFSGANLMNGLMRHIERARNVTLPGGRLAFRLGKVAVGWVLPELADRLCGLGCRRVGDAVVLDTPAALPGLARRLASEGWFAWRDEAFDVRADGDDDGHALATIDRGALPLFGIAAAGVHLNGLVRRADGLHLWVARRARAKALDPGKLDHLVAGGIGAGLSPMQTLIKEAAEEAGMPDSLTAQARHTGLVRYDMLRAEGLRRDRLHCFDLMLPEHFVPRPLDGEVESFALWPMEKVLNTVRNSDEFKFNVNLVLIDLFLRLGYIDAAGEEGVALRRSLTGYADSEIQFNKHKSG